VSGSITSANASFVLTIPGVYNSGVLLKGFAVDDMFDADPQALTKSSVGADSNSILDYVYARSKIRISFQANSDSIPVFYNWKAAQDAGVPAVPGGRPAVPGPDAIAASAKIVCPSLGLDVDLTNISLTSIPLIPPHKKVAETFVVELECDPGWQTTSK
jgi:hypothetical protein